MAVALGHRSCLGRGRGRPTTRAPREQARHRWLLVAGSYDELLEFIGTQAELLLARLSSDAGDRVLFLFELASGRAWNLRVASGSLVEATPRGVRIIPSTQTAYAVTLGELRAAIRK